MDKLKVLVVDDDVLFGATIVAGLQCYDMEALYQTSLTGLQEVVKKAKPNILLLDVEIGDNNSITEMQHIKVFVRDIPVIFMSGHSNMEYLQHALGEGGVSFLKKPFEIEELVAYIKRFALKKEKMSLDEGLAIGCLTLSLTTHVLWHKGKEICRLTPKQFVILDILVQNRGKVVTRDVLKQELWKDNNSSDASLDNFISQVRKICSVDNSITIDTIPKLGVILNWR